MATHIKKVAPSFYWITVDGGDENYRGVVKKTRDKTNPWEAKIVKIEVGTVRFVTITKTKRDALEEVEWVLNREFMA